MLRVASIFSGIGAFEFALRRLNINHEIIFACDNGEREVNIDYISEYRNIKSLSSPIEKRDYVNCLYSRLTRKQNYMQAAYEANYKIKDDMFFQDVCLLDGCDFEGKVDLFVGGSPCQSFSSVGCQKGLDDPRGNLFFQYTRLVSEIKPKVFIYENVRNLIKHDHGKTWEIIKQEFSYLGYSIQFAVLNAADYGIPQNRKRLFVVGFKDDYAINIPPKNIKLKYKMKDFLIDNCCEGRFGFSKNGNITIGNKKGSVDSKYILTPKLYAYVMKPGTKTFYQKPEINKDIARTILKTMGNRHRAGIDNYVSQDNSEELGKVRMLTEREALRLMGFTDDFVIAVSRCNVYKHAGNSIVVDVMMAVLKEIIETGVFDKN